MTTATETTSNGHGNLGFDPVDVEIFQRALYNAANEMGLIMIRTSGDPVISEAVDFSTFIADAAGEIISFSGYMTWHLGPARQTVRHIMSEVPAQDIHPGDAFICNDPFTTGACHPPDVGVVRPIFCGEELVAWCWAEAHLLDVGGMSPGGFAPGALECYAEALRFPGIKIMDRGRMIDDIRRLIMANFRIPVRNLNDIRCFVAACNVCDERLQTMFDRYGIEQFKRYAEISKDLSEQATRKRIASLPDGTYHSSEWVEHNGHVNDLFKVNCTVTIEGEQMNVDYSGSAPQTDGFVNLSLGGTVGATLTPVMCMLVPDIPFNEGVIRAVGIHAPLGTITNVQMPAPVSSGHMETGMRISKALTKLFSEVQAASSDPFLREHAMAPFHDAWIGNVFYAPDENGNVVPFLDMNGGGAGAGAQTSGDGQDCAGTFTQLNNGLPDIEINELQFPVLYLWRRLSPNSGGAGAQRGGQGLEFAWTPWYTPGGQEHVFSACWQVPAPGVYGGYPGSASAFRLAKQCGIDRILDRGHLPSSLSELEGDAEILECKRLGLLVGPGDVFSQHEGGGGGLADPLDRDGDRVAEDIRDGYVTAEVATDVYGVVLDDDGSLDRAATEQRREQIRRERTSWPSSAGELRTVSNDTPRRPVHWMLDAVRDGSGHEVLACRRCATILGDVSDDFHRRTCTRETGIAERLAELGAYCHPRSEAPHVRLREHACPGCGTMLAVELAVEDPSRESAKRPSEAGLAA